MGTSSSSSSPLQRHFFFRNGEWFDGEKIETSVYDWPESDNDDNKKNEKTKILEQKVEETKETKEKKMEEEIKEEMKQMKLREEHKENFKIYVFCQFCGICRFESEEILELSNSDMKFENFIQKYLYLHRSFKNCCNANECLKKSDEKDRLDLFSSFSKIREILPFEIKLQKDVIR